MNAHHSTTSDKPVAPDAQTPAEAAQRVRNARYAWDRPQTEPTTTVIVARRSFELEEMVDSATCHIAAEGRYRLMVNGQVLINGPCRSTPERPTYDTIDLMAYLQPGRNAMAIIVLAEADPTPRTLGNVSGLYVQGHIIAGDQVIHLDTPGQWRMTRPKAWSNTVASRMPSERHQRLGTIEIYDSRDQPVDWSDPCLDDSDWDVAVPIEALSAQRLEPRPIPILVERPCSPEKLLFIGDAEASLIDDDLTRQTLADTVVTPPRAVQFESPQALIHPGDAITRIVPPADDCTDPLALRNAVVAVDFGREVTAYARVELRGPAGTVVDFSYAERLVDGRIVAYAQFVSSCDRLILNGEWQTFQTLEWHGFRYLQIVFRNASTAIEVRRLDAVETHYPVKLEGRFDCSDDRLNRLWQIARHTLRCCMHDSFQDCPWREQRLWAGDTRTQILFNFAAFGERHLPARSAKLFGLVQESFGLVPPFWSRPLGTPILADYTLWWAIMPWDILLYTGDDSVYRDLRQPIHRALQWFADRIGPEGLIGPLEGNIFIDWAPLDRKGACIALNLIYAYALNALSRCEAHIHQSQQAQAFAARSQAMLDEVRRRAWSRERGLFSDAIVDSRLSDTFSQHTNALAVLTGAADDRQRESIRTRLLDDDLVPVEPYFFHYLLQALAKLDEHQNAIDLTRRKYAPMLDAGATTLWEEWQAHGTWRGGKAEPRPRSQCHAWSAGPLFFLSSHILGVRPTAPGFASVRIQPHPVDMSRINGTWPTPRGNIRVTVQRETSQWRCVLDVPDNTQAIFDPVFLDSNAEPRCLAPGHHAFDV